VQERLLGDWISLDDKETMKVRRLDDNIYIVYFDGDLFRAYHSDVADTLWSAFRISTLATASMLIWLGTCPMTASTCAYAAFKAN
jgi:hypothetical protein